MYSPQKSIAARSEGRSLGVHFNLQRLPRLFRVCLLITYGDTLGWLVCALDSVL